MRLERLEFPLCDACRKKYRSQVLIRYILIYFSVLFTIFAIATIDVFFHPPVFATIAPIALELAILHPVQKYLVEPLRPVRISGGGQILFHNQEYQRRFEQANSHEELED